MEIGLKYRLAMPLSALEMNPLKNPEAGLGSLADLVNTVAWPESYIQ
jgi:hypothetical protein